MSHSTLDQAISQAHHRHWWSSGDTPDAHFSASFIELPDELLTQIFNYLTNSKDALCLAIANRAFFVAYSLSSWSNLYIDILGLRCRLQRDSKAEAPRLYYCRECTSDSVPCDNHGVEAVASINKWRAFRAVNDPQLDLTSPIYQLSVEFKGYTWTVIEIAALNCTLIK